MTTPKDAERLHASYDSRTNSYGSRATIARHSQHLSDICPSPNSLLIVVRTAASTNSYGSRAILKDCKQIARKMGMSKSLRRCDRSYGVSNSYGSRTISCEFLAFPIASDRKATVRLM